MRGGIPPLQTFSMRAPYYVLIVKVLESNGTIFQPTMRRTGGEAPLALVPTPPTTSRVLHDPAFLPAATSRTTTTFLLFLVASLFPSSVAYLENKTTGTTAFGDDGVEVFPPYARGHVGYYGDPDLPRQFPLNQGSPLSAAQPKARYGYNPKVGARQNCPEMVGPINNKYYCGREEYGLCDRRSGTCFCNNGYSGLDCHACTPAFFWNGTFCLAKKRCPNDCSGAGVCNFFTGECACEPHRLKKDCSLPLCKVHDALCLQCTLDECLRCLPGYFVKTTQLPPFNDTRAQWCPFSNTCTRCLPLRVGTYVMLYKPFP